MQTANINPDKLRQLRSQIKSGLININELDGFLENIEMQLPDNKKKVFIEPVYHYGKMVNKKEFRAQFNKSKP